MHRQVGEDALALGQAGAGVAPAQHAAHAILVGRLPEQERGLRVATGEIARQRHAPASDRARQFGDIALAIAAIHAQGVQLQDLARQVLVQSGPARRHAAGRCAPPRPLAHRRVLADRGGVVQVAQHRRMGFHRHQQCVEAAEQVGPHRLAFHRCRVQRRGALVDRDGEMVGPEPHQPLGETVGRGCGVAMAQGQFTPGRFPQQADPRIGRCRLRISGGLCRPAFAHPRLARGHLLAQVVQAAGQAGKRAGTGITAQLRPQPGRRIGRDAAQFARPRTQAEAVGGTCRGVRDHARAPASDAGSNAPAPPRLTAAAQGATAGLDATGAGHGRPPCAPCAGAYFTSRRVNG